MDSPLHHPAPAAPTTPSTPADANARVCLLVAGMHRSGTSATTRLINLLGAKLPDNLMAANEQFNPAGFWESNDVVALNDELLIASRALWEDVLPLDLAGLPAPVLASFQTRAQALLADNFAVANWLVLKDPRIARVLPLWIAALQQQGAQVKVVIPLRHPLDVAASLARREGFPTEKSVHLWLRHMLDSVRYSLNACYGIVLYDELLQDWRTGIAHLAQALNLHWPVAAEQVASEIGSFLVPELRHHAHSGDLPEGTGPILTLAATLYAGLRSAAVNRSAASLESGEPVVTDAALLALIDTVERELHGLEQLNASFLRDHKQARWREFEARQRLEQQWLESREELGRAYAHVHELETVQAHERKLFRELDNEFNIKCTHLKQLGEELLQLRTMVQQLQEKLAKAGDTSAGSTTRLAWLAGLAEIERLVQEKQAKYARQEEEIRQNQQILTQQRRCREEIARAEAQLELLKDLLLSN